MVAVYFVACAALQFTAYADTTVRRCLTADAIKPWQHRSWIFPRGPDFAASEPAAGVKSGSVRCSVQCCPSKVIA
jgi:hypothetical protein